MTRVSSVNYDLRSKAKPDYVGLEEELKRSYKWWHYLESTWLIMTTESADELWDRIQPHCHKHDYALVIEVRNNSQGWLPAAAWQWINENVPASSAISL